MEEYLIFIGVALVIILSPGPDFIKNRREYSHLKEREGCSPVSRWEMNRLRTRGSLLAISIVRLLECYL